MSLIYYAVGLSAWFPSPLEVCTLFLVVYCPCATSYAVVNGERAEPKYHFPCHLSRSKYVGYYVVVKRGPFSVIRIQDFGDDGGSALKTLEPKLDLFKNHVFETLHFKVPPIEVYCSSVVTYLNVFLFVPVIVFYFIEGFLVSSGFAFVNDACRLSIC